MSSVILCDVDSASDYRADDVTIGGMALIEQTPVWLSLLLSHTCLHGVARVPHLDGRLMSCI